MLKWAAWYWTVINLTFTNHQYLCSELNIWLSQGPLVPNLAYKTFYKGPPSSKCSTFVTRQSTSLADINKVGTFIRTVDLNIPFKGALDSRHLYLLLCVLALCCSLEGCGDRVQTRNWLSNNKDNAFSPMNFRKNGNVRLLQSLWTPSIMFMSNWVFKDD